ncbi:MAG: hypothetical protein J6P03_06750 [Opitutales bacterium]|nr:hypothetical protein [Opitutales bacterium]
MKNWKNVLFVGAAFAASYAFAADEAAPQQAAAPQAAAQSVSSEVQTAEGSVQVSKEAGEKGVVVKANFSKLAGGKKVIDMVGILAGATGTQCTPEQQAAMAAFVEGLKTSDLGETDPLQPLLLTMNVAPDGKLDFSLATKNQVITFAPDIVVEDGSIAVKGDVVNGEAKTSVDVAVKDNNVSGTVNGAAVNSTTPAAPAAPAESSSSASSAASTTSAAEAAAESANASEPDNSVVSEEDSVTIRK